MSTTSNGVADSESWSCPPCRLTRILQRLEINGVQRCTWFDGHPSQKHRDWAMWLCFTNKWEQILNSFYLVVKSIQSSISVDSYIACRVHAVPLPCRAVKALECVFPIWFTQCGRVWFTFTMPCPCYAPTMPSFSRPRQSTFVERRPVGYLPAFGFFRLPRGIPRRLLSDAYQSQMQVTSVKPNTVCHGRGKEW